MTDSPRPTPDRLRTLPSRLLAQAAQQGDRLVTGGLAAVGARRWHYAVLAALQEYGPASQAELSRRAGVYRSDMVAVLNELADGGHVRRTPDRDDKRRNVITITEQGRRRLDQLDGLIDGIQGELLAPLSPAERGELVRLLTVLAAHYGDAMPDRM
ncbi:MarR family winged helix-turn-helix transcriptional regulator [Actinacidiphila paucisporea]|uniref:DNA-binding transcriptional regulator, MarR family n=1 Tax=Actinacidiphila paucisporea TaxID=310782 RepID=A0A1M6Z504_9ACTN|nr:MarR family transcriptional regulator [Actinacidiphila paucisporea]SHL25419.1 DNA-binding transcriptional regulator, MarR family [Actinacidiphila paucisporea]